MTTWYRCGCGALKACGLPKQPTRRLICIGDCKPWHTMHTVVTEFEQRMLAAAEHGEVMRQLFAELVVGEHRLMPN